MRFQVKDYEIDVLGQSVYQDLLALPPFADSIIAGGYIRDIVLGGTFTDIDIFTPVLNVRMWLDTLENEYLSTQVVEDPETSRKKVEAYLGKDKHFTNIKYSTSRSKGYNFSTFKQLIECKYMGIDIDIIAVPFTKKPELFPEYVLNTFNYHVDKMYYNGKIVISKEAFSDVQSNSATLCKLDSMSELPNAFKKFEKMRVKYPHLVFGSTCLELKKGIEKSIKTGSATNYYDDYAGQLGGRPAIENVNVVWEPRFQNEFDRDAEFNRQLNQVRIEQQRDFQQMAHREFNPAAEIPLEPQAAVQDHWNQLLRPVGAHNIERR